MQQDKYLIHEVAKEMNVESHVLRYWEEELGLQVERNERGHRVYSREDVEKLTYIRYLKEQGLKLKAIRNWMSEERNEINNKNVIPIQVGYLDRKKDTQMIEIKERKMTNKEKEEIALKMKENKISENDMNDKAYKMQLILQKIISNCIKENNNCIINEISDNIRNDLVKEFDYQMRIFQAEEDKREEKRKEYQKELVEQTLTKQEEHYKKLDELLRQKTMKNEALKKVPLKKDTKWSHILSNNE